MRKISIILSFILMISFFACNKDNPEAKTENSNNSGVHKIEVIKHMDAAGYTYILSSENGREYWIAVSQMNVEDGETLYYTSSMEMKNFTSKALNKTFDSILFVQDISKNKESSSGKMISPMMSSPHSGLSSAPKKDIKVKPLKDGLTVEKIYEDKDKLNGKVVRVKGVVTKYNGGIMNRNWIHIQDGTSYENFNDLAVTSNDAAAEGETIVVEGTLAVDKDFGAGYKYNVIIEKAKISK